MGKEALETEAAEASETAAAEAEEAAEASADEASEAEAATSSDNGSSASESGDEGVVDKHGHPAISQGKYQRDIEAKDAKIAELEAKLEEAAETKEGRDRLTKEISDLKAQMASDKVTHALELAGCRNVKAAKAVLEDFDGDVAALKEKHPYLFEQKQSGSTGAKPAGAAKGEDDMLDRAFGLK